ncbi:alpha/beta fold hydrolase [Leptospira stimsonii]|uniref:Alpha/beta hydrolase n=1 Tax=Leptospira stimsonii TaxID=2202203 RepID=A0A8B3CSY3_9LEPT|nr:alpha/beta hydrolase [Leptospira stimsonii]RHX87805.1 alpha/beta hydrolase [Leptospira stimsonii]
MKNNRFRHQFISSGNIKLHVVTVGNPKNPPLLFLHGFPEFWYGWKNQIDFFLIQGYFLILPDLRGYAESGKPWFFSSYRISLLSFDIVSILDSLQIEKADCIAHDWGAAVIWNSLYENPERFRNVCILNMPHLETIKHTILNDKIQRKKTSYIFFFLLPLIPEYLLIRNKFRMLWNSLIKTSNKGSFSSEDFLHYRKAWSGFRTVRSMLNWYRAAIFFPPKLPKEKNRKLPHPVKIFWGERDPFLKKEMGKDSLSFLENGEYQGFSATHWLHHDIPEILNPSLYEFLQR